MAKYSYEQRLEVVMGVLEKKLTYPAAGNLIGACKGDAQTWVRLYQEHGAAGLVMKKGTYDGQFKIDVIEYMHTHHISAREAAAKFGVPGHGIVSRWERIYYEEGQEALFRDNRGRKKMSKDKNPRKPKLGKKTKMI